MDKPASKPVVLFVDDDRLIRNAIARIMHDKPFDVVTAESAEHAMDFLKKTTVHVVVSDEAMMGTSGSEFLIWVAEWFPRIPRIMLTGQPNLSGMQKLLNHGGVYRFLNKPADDVELTMCIFDALESVGISCEIAS